MSTSRFMEGLLLYQEGHYWLSHEVWEELWQDATGEQAEFYRALIQLDAALIHLERREWDGARRLLTRLSQRLNSCQNHEGEINVDLLRKQIRTVLHEVALVQSGRKADFDWTLKPSLVRVDCESPGSAWQGAGRS